MVDLPLPETRLTSDVPQSACPYCEQTYKVTTSVGAAAPPSAGDWAVCYNCAQFLVYNEQLMVRKPHPGEVARMTQKNPKRRRMLDKVAAWIRERDRR